MFGVTARQRAAAWVALLTGAAAAIAATLEQWRLAAAAGAVLLTGLALAALDIRRRHGQFVQRLSDSAGRLDALSSRLRRDADHIEAVQQELRSAVAAIRTDDLPAMTARVATLDDELRRHLGGATGFRTDVTGLIRDQTREVEALFQLFGRIQPQEPMPPSGRWALNPQGLLNLCALARRHRPKLVVELGSGTSTIWLGYALADLAQSRLVSLDHDPEYAERTRDAARLHEAWTARTEVRHAALVPAELGDHRYDWYDPEQLADLDRIDLLVVDGPPGRTGREARYPALPLMSDRLADGARVVLDDLDRTDEQRIVARWLDEFPNLSRERTLVGNQAVLRWSAGPAATSTGR
jgi:predicted O-methyltransferase YrrM